MRLYYYVIDIVITKIPSLNFFSQTANSPFDVIAYCFYCLPRNIVHFLGL